MDFNAFSQLKNLESLMVSGGEISDMKLENLDALSELKQLRSLRLHEFGSVDLKPLGEIPWLKDFFCGYANEVNNVEAIGMLPELESLELVGIDIQNIDFFDMLDDKVELDLCGLLIKERVDLSRFNRFRNLEICEIDMPTADGVGYERLLC